MVLGSDIGLAFFGLVGLFRIGFFGFGCAACINLYSMTGIDKIERPIGRRLIDAAGRVDKISADDTTKHPYLHFISHLMPV